MITIILIISTVLSLVFYLVTTSYKQPLLFIIIHSLLVMDLALSSVSILIYYTDTQSYIGYFILSFVVLFIIEQEYFHYRLHYLLNDFKQVIYPLLNVFVLVMVVNLLFLVVINYLPPTHYGYQILVFIVLCGLYILLQSSIKFIDIYSEKKTSIVLPILIFIVILSMAIQYKEPRRTEEIKTYDNDHLILPISLDRTNSKEVESFNSIKVRDYYFGQKYIYFVQDTSTRKLFAYDIAKHQTSMIYENDDSYLYEDDFIQLIVHQDITYLLTPTGLYYIDDVTIVPIIEQSLTFSMIQFDDYYGALYLAAYSDDVTDQTLFYETKEARYVINDTLASLYPLPYDLQSLPNNVHDDSPIVHIHKMNLELTQYAYVELEDGNEILMSRTTSSYSGKVQTMTELQEDRWYNHYFYSGYEGTVSIDGVDFTVTHQRQNDINSDIYLEHSDVFCIDTENTRSYLTLIDEEPILVEIEYIQTYPGLDIITISHLEVLPPTINTTLFQTIRPFFGLGLLIIFIPILKQKDPFIE